MKILFVHDIPLNTVNHNNDLQNSIISVSFLCQAMAKLNHSVSLVLPVVSDSESVMINWFQANLLEEIRFNIVPLNTNPRKRRIWRYIISTEIADLIKSSNPDLVITRNPIWGLSLRDLSPKLIIDIHSHRISKFKLIDIFFRKKLINNIKKSKRIHIVTISKSLATLLSDLGYPSNYITVAHNGFEPNSNFEIAKKNQFRDTLNLPRSLKIVLYAGSFWSVRGVEMLLEIAKEMKEITFIMIGGPESFRLSLIKKAQLLKIENVQILSSLSRNKLMNYLFASDILVGIFSSKLLTAEYFSSLKLIEYLSTGIPVVSQDFNGVLELITDRVTGFIAKRDSSHSLSEKISEALNNPDSYNIGLRARNMAFEQLTWHHRAKKFLDSLYIL